MRKYQGPHSELWVYQCDHPEDGAERPTGTGDRAIAEEAARAHADRFHPDDKAEVVIMNEFIVPETGEYRLWTYAPDGSEIQVLIDGVPCNTASSTLGPTFGEAKIEIVLEQLAEGTVITTEPGNAPLVVHTSDGKVVYDTAGDAVL
jgi:hypothetical protein